MWENHRQERRRGRAGDGNRRILIRTDEKNRSCFDSGEAASGGTSDGMTRYARHAGFQII